MRGSRKNKIKYLHSLNPVVDAHCDTLTAMIDQNRRLNDQGGAGQLDLQRMKKGGIKLQFFAVFVHPNFKNNALKRALLLIDHFFKEVEANEKEIMHVKNMEDIKNAFVLKKIAALLSVEGGEALEGHIMVLRTLYRLGVRSLTLTWNGRNELGDGVGVESGAGLTAFGKEVVEEMNRLKMIIDVSHLSEEGFWDVMALSRDPVIASHSNCKSIYGHKRNLNDDQIRAIAEKAGVVGITFVPNFLGGDRTTVNAVLDHIDHAVKIGGIDCVGIGSDFDGTDQLPGGLDDCSQIGSITKGLVKRGYDDTAVTKIIGGNFLRLIGQVLV